MTKISSKPLVGQRKLALTARNTLFAKKIIGAQKKNRPPCPLFRPKTKHTRHQKPNPSLETVPLTDEKNLNMARFQYMKH